MDVEKVIRRLENAKGNFWEWVLTIFAFCLFRLFLDIVFSGESYKILILNNVDILIEQYFLWYVALFLAVTIMLWLVTEERIEIISKVVFLFFPLILIVPIIDWFFSGGEGYILTYISAEHFWEEFCSFFGLFGSYHVTYGQAIAVFIGFLFVNAYVFFKTRSVCAIILSAFSYYIIIYFFGSLPVFFTNKTTLGLFFLTILEGIVWLFTYNKKKFFGLAKNMHMLRAFHYLALCFSGVFVFFLYSKNPINVDTLLFALASIFFAFQYALMVNNIFDKERLLYNFDESISLCIIFAFLSLSAAIFINDVSLWIIMLSMLLSFIYSAPPIRFKRFGFLNNILIGVESALAFAVGFASQTPNIELMPLNIFVMIFVVFSLASNIKDLKDYKWDKKKHIPTLPVLLGKEKSVKVLALITSLCFPLSIIMLEFWRLLFTSILFGLINGILLLKFKDEKVVFACYFAFMIVLLFLSIYF